MKEVISLQLGFNDAENYRRSENRKLFNDVFVRDSKLDDLLKLSSYFLIGEKGTGKTAYAVYLANNDYHETRSSLRYLRETEYRKFVELKKQHHLVLSDYVSIWRVIILVLVASAIKEDELDNRFMARAQKLKAVRNAIDEYYSSAFSPEIVTTLQLVDNSKRAAELFAKYFKFGAEENSTYTFNESKFQLNLQYIERHLESSLDDLLLTYNRVLFIDGIDIRPEGIEYKDYLDCVKGLANAVWSINNDYFAPIKGSKGRLRVVMLLRPDIFDSIGMQNQSNKLRDNSVYLDWRTTYPAYRESLLFQLSDRLLSHQQADEKGLEVGKVWDHYLDWQAPTTSTAREYDPPFVEMLRMSYSRPRDIVTILLLLQEEMKRVKDLSDYFPRKYFISYEFKNAYSEYLMSGIKDQLAFYYSPADYNLLLRFLSYFKGNAEFSYETYLEKYKLFTAYVLDKASELPEFIDTPEMFLQFLYDANIICYIEEGAYEPFFRWCYRERNSSNIKPKVFFGLKYRFHYGLLRELGIGSYR